ncbi:MAG: nucleotide sugar epimerase, partial [Gemmatimonadetes bacterium GWC2_71_9]
GCVGFIGAKVTEFLLGDGHAVVGVDNLNDAYDVRLKQWRLAQLEGWSEFAFHKLDVTDLGALRRLLGAARSDAADRAAGDGRPFDAGVHLAARAGVRESARNPWIYLETNVTGTLNLLELCREFGIGKFVLASTSSLYGAENARPFREDANTDHPLSAYAASKRAAEGLCYTYHHAHGLDVTVLRYFTVYGPAGRPEMSVFRFVQWLKESRALTVYGDGGQSRDFTYIDDIARGTVAALRPLGFEVVNLGSDRPIVLMDVIRLLEKLIGAEAVVEYQPPDPADVPATWAAIGKAERVLGWRPETSFEDGIKRAVDWYLGNRDWARHIRTSST